MHAHDRTMIARLGFGDPDKKNDLHDQACRYLAENEPAATLFDLFLPDSLKETMKTDVLKCGHGDAIEKVTITTPYDIRSRFEVPVEKGENQYKTTIGFLDLMLTLVREIYVQQSGPCVACRSMGKLPSRDKYGTNLYLFVEVKIARESMGTCIRQIRLYRSYMHVSAPWILATKWAIDEDEKKMLDDSDILHVRLGTGFEEFCKKAPKASGSPEL
jgi:hypothetical protein